MVTKKNQKTITMSRVFLAGAAAVLTAALATAPDNAAAGTDTDTITVQATVGNSCTISGGTLNFGAYDPFAGTANDNTMNLTVRCTQGAATWVGLDNGVNGGGTSRVMVAGAETLNYELYREAGRSTVWGVNDPLTATTSLGVSHTGTGADAAVTVYGRIPAGQTGADAGNYSDTVTATINF